MFSEEEDAFKFLESIEGKKSNFSKPQMLMYNTGYRLNKCKDLVKKYILNNEGKEQDAFKNK